MNLYFKYNCIATIITVAILAELSKATAAETENETNTNSTAPALECYHSSGCFNPTENPECYKAYAYEGDQKQTLSGKACVAGDNETDVCRNPTNETMGPWCYTNATLDEGSKEACFKICEPCENTANECHNFQLQHCKDKLTMDSTWHSVNQSAFGMACQSWTELWKDEYITETILWNVNFSRYTDVFAANDRSCHIFKDEWDPQPYCLNKDDDSMVAIQPCTKPCSCRSGYSQCSKSGECIYKSWFCDGWTDCYFGEDEDNCADFDLPAKCINETTGLYQSNMDKCHWDAIYLGNKSISKTGTTCQAWSGKVLRKSNDIVPYSLKENFCRNPTFNKGGPWCYVDANMTKMEHCFEPAPCHTENQTRCHFSECIDNTLFCDKKVDCSNAYDEKNCSYSCIDNNRQCFNYNWQACRHHTKYNGTKSETHANETCLPWSDIPKSRQDIVNRPNGEGGYCETITTPLVGMKNVQLFGHDSQPICMVEGDRQWGYCFIPCECGDGERFCPKTSICREDGQFCDLEAHCLDAEDEQNCTENSCRTQNGEQECWNPDLADCQGSAAYLGSKSVSIHDATCLIWNTTAQPKLDAMNTLALKENQCRNPDRRITGPWCFVQGENGTVKEQSCFHICDCADSGFRCKKSMECIAMDKQCDGYFDCSDKSDEQNCSYIDVCFPNDSETNKTCFNFTTEFDCTRPAVYDPSVTTTTSGTKCVYFYYRDGIYDYEKSCRNPKSQPFGPYCYDHYKWNLPPKPCYETCECPENYTRCIFGPCIPDSKMCDTVSDCPYKDDEASCEYECYDETSSCWHTELTHCQGAIYFDNTSISVNNRTCLDWSTIASYYGDSENYCRNFRYTRDRNFGIGEIAGPWCIVEASGNNEINWEHCMKPCECKSGEYYCTNTAKCVPAANRCDGVAHCVDAEDERDCANRTCLNDDPVCWKPDESGCGGEASYFGTVSTTINNNTCARWDSLNSTQPVGKVNHYFSLEENYCRNPDNSDDGPWCYIDGDDGARENCFDLCKCENDGFRCEDKQCIEKTAVCDGYVHCSEKEDELNCKRECFKTVTNTTVTCWDKNADSTCTFEAAYLGDRSRTMSDVECLDWSAIGPDSLGTNVTMSLLEGNYCRNPTKDADGPYCHVSANSTGYCFDECDDEEGSDEAEA